MNKYGLIGKNIAYSLSPKLHNLIANYSNYQLDYEVIDIDEKSLNEYLKQLKTGVYQGFNVTIPYKEVIVKYLDKISPKAEKIGAVNTVYLDEEGKIVGDNTDYFGFLKLLEINSVLTNVKRVYVLGTGGAAKTIYHVLKDLSVEVIVTSRDKNQVTGFTEVISYEEFSKVEEMELLVNCTPVGTYPKGGMPIKDNNQKIRKIVDLIYNPLKTELMSLAKESYNGLEMLIYQAILSQKLFKNIVNDEIEVIKLIKEALINEFIR